MTFLKKYIDALFIILGGILLILAHEFGYFEKLSPYALLFLLAAYAIGKYVGVWQRKSKS